MWIDAPLLAGPGRRHADPARAVGVVLALPVPVELDLHPAVLVGEDLLAGIADDDGRLRPLDAGLGVVRAGRNGSAAGMHSNVFLYDRRRLVAGGIGIAHGGEVLDSGQDVRRCR